MAKLHNKYKFENDDDPFSKQQRCRSKTVATAKRIRYLFFCGLYLVVGTVSGLSPLQRLKKHTTNDGENQRRTLTVSRRRWIDRVIVASSGGVLLDTTMLRSPLPAVAELDSLPNELKSYTALAPLGVPEALGSKSTGMTLSDIATRLSKDLVEGNRGEGGYFVTGDLSTDLFRDDCTFVDPTNSVSSLSRYQKALRILFEPDLSTVKLLEPLVVDNNRRTITGKLRSWGVLQLPWKPRISSYETSIVYSVDDDGLIFRQEQKWSIPASEALQETFLPGSLSPPFSNLSRPSDEPETVTELFDIINGHRQGSSYPQNIRLKVESLIAKIVDQKYPWKRDKLPGKWALAYLQSGPNGAGVDRRIPFPELWFNDSYQIFTKDSVTNVGELLGPLLEVRVGGSLEEKNPSSLSTPKRFQANITGGKLCLGRAEDASCLPIPISGEGLFDGVYVGERLRIGQNLNGGGAIVVQIKIA